MQKDHKYTGQHVMLMRNDVIKKVNYNPACAFNKSLHRDFQLSKWNKRISEILSQANVKKILFT